VGPLRLRVRAQQVSIASGGLNPTDQAVMFCRRTPGGRVATKICPDCGAEVPTSAARCKDCFHDFNEQRTPRSGPLVLLAALAAESPQAATSTTQYRTGPATDRLDWTDITALEHVVTAAGKFQIVALTRTGDRVIIQQSTDRSIQSDAEHYSKVMGKPLQLVDNTRGFHKSAKPE